jgi:hypothetical protein
MTTNSLEHFYAKIQGDLDVAEHYTEMEHFSFILKSCRLKPYEDVSTKHPATLHQFWFDEFGNSLTINQKKQTKILLNDLSLDQKKISNTDLYYGLTIKNVAKMSKVIHLIAGKDEDLLQDCGLLTFLGLDDYFRSYLLWFGEWKQVSPLMLGIKNLLTIADNRNLREYRQMKRKIDLSILPCVEGEWWLGCSGSDKFLELLKMKYETIYEAIR